MVYLTTGLILDVWNTAMWEAAINEEDLDFSKFEIDFKSDNFSQYEPADNVFQIVHEKSNDKITEITEEKYEEIKNRIEDHAQATILVYFDCLKNREGGYAL